MLDGGYLSAGLINLRIMADQVGIATASDKSSSIMAGCGSPRARSVECNPGGRTRGM